MSIGNFFQNISLAEFLVFLLIPLIAALIGWFTNYVAIKMLFYPRFEKRFLGIPFQGVFPKRQKQLGIKLGELFAERLGVQKSIENEIVSVVDLEKYKQVLEKKVIEAAYEFINSEMPFLVAMLPNDLIKTLSSKVSIKLYEEIKIQFEKSMQMLSNKVDIKTIVEKEVVALDAEELEIMLQDLLKKEFRFIEISGAVLGFMIGCLQLLLTKII